MKKSWKIVGVLILLVMILGMIFIGVGMLTGASPEDVYITLDREYGIYSIYQKCADYLVQVRDAFVAARF